MIAFPQFVFLAGLLQVSICPMGKIEHLLCLARNYSQVEKTVLLLPRNNRFITKVPCISPLRAEDLRHIPISSSYGTRLHPILNEYKHHSGVDLPGTKGEKVYAAADGVVTTANYERLIGNFVKLQHAYGFTTIYGHLDSYCVTKGDSIHIGQVIGYIGSTGRSTGPHLHYGIKKYGKEQNPLPYCYLYLRWLKKVDK